MGYLAGHGDVDADAFRRGLAYGTVCASLTVEDFSLRRIANISRREIDERFEIYRRMLAIV